MNLMILSPGRRVEIVNYFKNEFNNKGFKVYTLDMSPYAPALYEGDEGFVVEKNFNDLDSYIDNVIEICVSKNVGAIITLIDPELVLLAKNKDKFLKNNIIPIVSNLDTIMYTFDKYDFSKRMKDIVNVIPTYKSYNDIKKAIKNEEVQFPIFAKVKDGSGSVGIGKIDNVNELEAYINKDNYIFQPYVKEKEYGVDIFFDMIDGKIKKYFIKEKLNMRAGETDKSISVYKKEIFDIVNKLEGLGFFGPIDMDIFEDKHGNLYVNEINPRFGGGYSHAYNSGVDFIQCIYKNLIGEINEKNMGEYEEGLLMLKYNGTKFIKKDEIKLI